MIESEKKIIRKELIYLRDSLSEKTKKNADSQICKRLCRLNEAESAERVAAYIAHKNEVDLTSFFAKFAEKKFIFPRYEYDPLENNPGYEMVEVPGKVFTDKTLKDCFVPGKYGILEPEKSFPVVSLTDIDLWLVPGLGFDKTGNRIGRGGGIYDRLLSVASGLKVGIGYDFQIMGRVPSGPYDIKMDLIITEVEEIRF